MQVLMADFFMADQLTSQVNSEGTYLVQTKDLVQIRANLLNKVSKNSEKNHECASQITSSIYKI